MVNRDLRLCVRASINACVCVVVLCQCECVRARLRAICVCVCVFTYVSQFDEWTRDVFSTRMDIGHAHTTNTHVRLPINRDSFFQ